MDDKANLRWWHYIVFALLLMTIGYVIVSCGGLFAPTARADDTTDIHYLINAYRVSQGLQPFLVDNRLVAASETHNRWMRDNDCFAHQCPGEPSPDARARAQGWNGRYILEDIGYGYTSPAAVVAGWMASPGHRAAILDDAATEAGAHYLDGYGDGSSYLAMWWTLDIGVGGTVKPTLTPAPTVRPQLPPAGWVMRVEARPSAGWAVWDALYTFCNKIGVTCTWYRSP